ncbi:MAG: branched-chain amino acid ABC transporter permease [Burkholderiales bacterium]|nr:branched-chain amino acid ABC transporter permease [Burkholderiales bacterium]
MLFAAGAIALAALPYAGVPPFTITLLTEAFIFAIWAMSLDLLVGYTGLVTFGHAAAFGLGSYAAGYFAREVTADFFAALLVAEAIVVGLAVTIGFVVTRVSGVAFAIISLAIAQVLFQIAIAWRPVTEGMDGLVGVPLPKIAGFTIDAGAEFYLLTIATLVLVYLGLSRLVASSFGRTLQAIRTNEERAAAIGINVRLHKWIAFTVSWGVAGIGGTLMVFMKAGTTPMSLHWSESGNVLVMAIFGGVGTLFGPMIGAVAFVFLRDEFTTRFEAWQLAFGLVFVVVVLAFPSGLAGIFARAWRALWPTRS